MPANLPPQYFDVEKKYREAKSPHEKLGYLQEMLAIIPKHKGTEKLQADIKTRISKIKDEMVRQKKSQSSGGGGWYQVEKQGAGQIIFVGLPNSGKSSLLNELTNAHAEVGAYPFTTTFPQIGMMDFENIKIQIVDTPPLHADAPPWLFGLYRNGDILMIILDSTSDLAKDFQTIVDSLKERNLSTKPGEIGDVKETIVVLNKIDLLKDHAHKEKFMAQHQNDYSIIAVAQNDINGKASLKKEIFHKLNIIRVYTKKIGKPVSRDEPIVLKRGTTLIDAAEYIHKDFKKDLKFARLWNDKDYNGQRVEKNHILVDGDVIEFHV